MAIRLKVMSYNVQWFTGVNSQVAMQKKIMEKHGADIIGLQELSVNGNVSRVGQEVLAGYPHQYMSKHKNYLGIASKAALMDVRCRDFRHQDPEDMARYGETRAYMTAVLEIGGKQVTVINTHLCYLTADVKYRQMKEIFNRAERSEYVIILGDFNCFNREYGPMFKRFADAGYHLANCGEKTVKTWTDMANPKSLKQFTFPTDNIITSGNIAIKKVRFDRTKLRYPDGNPMDHIPVVARLQIK